MGEKSKEKSLHKALGDLRTRGQKTINNVHIWSALAKSALSAKANDGDFISKTSHEVPSLIKDNSSGKKVEIRKGKVSRSPEQVVAIINNAVGFELNYSVFVYLVAHMEAFFNDVLYELLCYDNRRLKTRVKGIDFEAKIDVNDLIDAEDKDDLVCQVVRRQLISVFYASPALQMEYFQKITGVELSDDLVSSWIEMKAARDIIVHSLGVVNELYVRKSGNKARGNIGERVLIDDEYLDSGMAVMKSIIGRAISFLQREIKKHAAA
ncbi:hypothetical protein A203_05425 [Chromobacterium violaceum]|uniref:hypothetical protein n=1 Tax=Chromobacterium violaceum TaxID=536 RepID=UPI003CEC7885